MGEVKEAFELPEKKVTIKYIKKAKGLAAGVGENHVISGGMLDGSYKGFCVPKLKSGGYTNVLSKEEKEFFEQTKFRGVNLSVYSNFWKDYMVRLYKDDTILDLSVPEDYLKYKVLLAWTKVICPSLEEYKKFQRPSYQFLIEEEGEATQERGKELSKVKEAWKLYSKYEDNKDILMSVISLLSNKNLASESKIEFVREVAEDLIDKNPANFVKLVKDANFESKVLITRAVNAGIIKVISGSYETIEGLKLAHKGDIATLDNAVKFLNDAKNQDLVELIKARLSNTKE